MKQRHHILPTIIATLLFSGFAAGQTSETLQSEIVSGRTEMSDGSPVALTEANYTLTETVSREERFKKTRESVKLTNLTERAIKQTIVCFSFEGHGGFGRVSVPTGPIPAGETISFVSTGSRSGATSNDGDFVVRLLGVEFTDGTHWIAPRTVFSPLYSQSLGHQAAPLVIRQCREINKSYQAELLLEQTSVVAYRLGVVRDTPDRFEVRLGRWVEVPSTAQTKQDRFTVTANDSILSLMPAEIFPREKQVMLLLDGTQTTGYYGVALFVAEVKLADGTNWKQDLRRAELLWGEIRQ